MQRTRPGVLARNGMVASPHYLASAAGLRALQDGGSAVDAAIAVNATLGVVYPHMTGPGGDAFWLIFDAESESLYALNGSGRAGGAATREAIRSLGHDAIPVRGPLSAVTVPGAVDSWCTAHDRFGVLPLSRLLEPAVGYARDGYAVCKGQSETLYAVRELLTGFEGTREMLLPRGRPPRIGEILRLPRLAETLESVAEKGRSGFYQGWVAEEIVASLQRDGGLLTVDDFTSHHSDWTTPISTSYRGFDCYQHPPNSQGFTHLMVLNILEGYDVAGMGEDSADYLHTVVEATKLAFVDRDRYLTDPDFASMPLTDLLSKEYAAELRRQIDPDRARPPASATTPDGDTTCSVVVDAAGNAVSVLQSLYHECGSGFVAGDTGVLLQNRGSFFTLDETHPNTLEPGKRTFHTLMPGMLLRDGSPFLTYGTMGGEGQPQTCTALVTRVVDFHQDVQQAIDRPRWLFGRTWGEETRDLRVEARFPGAVITQLHDRGHPIHVTKDWDDVMGHAQAIHVATREGNTDDDTDNPARDAGPPVLIGGADARGEGFALGW